MWGEVPFSESAVGKLAKYKKCGLVFTLTAYDEDGTIPIADDGIVDVMTPVTGR